MEKILLQKIGIKRKFRSQQLTNCNSCLINDLLVDRLRDLQIAVRYNRPRATLHAAQNLKRYSPQKREKERNVDTFQTRWP